MPATVIRLPNGQAFTATPVFDGFHFRSHDMDLHHSAFPPGWTIVLRTSSDAEFPAEGEHGAVRFSQPTLRRDYLYFSSISMPSTNDFKAPTSPTRLIAMLLWATLWWYFHLPDPSSQSSEADAPNRDWRLMIKREGIFKGRLLLQKLERMGLIASEDSSVGLDTADVRFPAGWTSMFASRRSFWQLDPRIFLFTLTPKLNSPMPSASPFTSRPGSPMKDPGWPVSRPESGDANSLWCGYSGNPFESGSHLPTYFPPSPTQLTRTKGIQHPLRPKPPRQGEVFYVRHVPSVDQYLSFRIPSLSLPKALPPVDATLLPGASIAVSALNRASVWQTDLEWLKRWMDNPRLKHEMSIPEAVSAQDEFLRQRLLSRHDIPVIGCWDGRPFGYFEIFWAKEDASSEMLHAPVGNYVRGFRGLGGEEELWTPHLAAVWISALVHHCFMADLRTDMVITEPSIDDTRLITLLEKAAFVRTGEAESFGQRYAVMKIERDAWESPAI